MGIGLLSFSIDIPFPAMIIITLGKKEIKELQVRGFLLFHIRG
jgi:hypothetical protein